ncbi:MAG: ABC transporter ATP-binding protein [Myxococcota bacterium]
MRIEVTGLRKSYLLDGQEIPVLHGVDLVIERGEFVSLTGPSGVGKSTLLHVLGTLDIPTGGRVVMDGTDVFAQTPAGIAEFRNRHIGFVFQFHHLLPEFTALENTMMPALVARVPKARAAQRARELLSEVGLGHRLGHRPGELSGGEQQRVALARALVNEPELLLADEPTGNLDERTGAGIHELIERLNQQRGITALLVTHNPRLALRMRRRIQLTREGVREGAFEPDHSSLHRDSVRSSSDG